MNAEFNNKTRFRFRKSVIVIAALHLVACRLCQAAAAEPPAADTDAISLVLSATFKITSKEASGTCFLIEPPPKPGWSNRAAILVTAAHALEQAPGPDCRVVMRERRHDGGWLRKEIPLTIREGSKPVWVKHPEEDVAALKIILPAGVTCRPLRLEQLARAEDFSNGRIRLGHEAWIFCFPAQLEANDAGFPVLRHGTIASLPLTPLSANRTFLVDFNTFGGDSGAPVMLGERGPGQAPLLVVGLVMGMQRQTDKVSMPFEERTVHHPLGLSIVAHAVILRQTVERLLAQP